MQGRKAPPPEQRAVCGHASPLRASAMSATREHVSYAAQFRATKLMNIIKCAGHVVTVL